MDGGIGEAPEPVLVIVGAHVTSTDEAQKVVSAALFPLSDTLYGFHYAFTSFDVGTSL